MVDDAKVNNKTLGERGEAIAVAYLKGQKFTIIDRNFRCKAGEVDIVARDGNNVRLCRGQDPQNIVMRSAASFRHPLQAAPEFQGGPDLAGQEPAP